MWKPAAVIPEHRWRAKIVWGSLLVSIAAYTAWQIWRIFDGYQNISTRLEVTDEMSEFPFVLMCFFDGQGCGYANGNTDQCVADALEFSYVWFKDGEVEDVVVATQWSNCVGFDLEKIDLTEVEPEAAYVSISAEWWQSDEASLEVGFTHHVGIYLSEGEPEESELLFTYVPYMRIIPDDVEDKLVMDVNAAELAFGKTTKKKLNGDVETTYPPLLMSSSIHTTANFLSEIVDPSLDVAYARMYLNLRQGSFSRTSVEEISPLDVGGFLGNIGGFWELLLVCWGLFFIAARPEREKLKARNFAKSVAKGKEVVTRRRSLSVDSSASASREEARSQWDSASQGSTRRRSLLVDSSASASREEARPQWDSASQGSSNPAAWPPVGGTATAGGVAFSGARATTAGGTAFAAGFPAAMPPGNGDSVATRRASNVSSTVSGGNGNEDHHGNSASSSSGENGSAARRYRRPVVSDMPRRGSRGSVDSHSSHEPAPPSYADMTNK